MMAILQLTILMILVVAVLPIQANSIRASLAMMTLITIVIPLSTTRLIQAVRARRIRMSLTLRQPVPTAATMTAMVGLTIPLIQAVRALAILMKPILPQVIVMMA